MQELYENLRVLIVDDNLMMRSMINQGLQSSGIGHTDMATNGEEAFTKIEKAHVKSEPYHVVFLDWHMPIMEGYDVLKKCRADERFKKTAFVMLTAEQEEENVIKAIEAGATSYLVKPIALNALRKNLDKVIKWLEKNGVDFSVAQKKTLM